ncbi:MAG TPA: hypothetical protein VNY52_02755, partial [Solirubrobacteraceae bacterium]|nr:hypothetical protein [Solirubrobacteraceae bacterium]
MRGPRGLLAPVVWLVLLAVLGALATSAAAAGLSDDGGAEWRVEQPEPPPPPPGVEGLKAPIGLGRIGDIEFWAPNRGALITGGNGSTVLPGVWLYNGERWRELATVCGATDGRIAWAGPDEFWTISDGRPGQAVLNASERPPLEDNTLCHFAPGPTGKFEVVASYASLAFLSTSYQAMHAAACIGPSDCWFAGDALENPQVGAFQLHWNGHSLEAEPYLPEGHAVESMRELEGKLYESVRLLQVCGGEVISDCDRVAKVLRHPPALHIINGEGAQRTFEAISELPLYGEEEFYSALNYLHLSAGESSLWGAAGPELETPKGSIPAGVTIIRLQAGAPAWSQVLGPQTTPSGSEVFPEDVVDSIAAEPASNSAWIALDSETDAGREEPSLGVPAVVARVSANGTVSDVLQLPS